MIFEHFENIVQSVKLNERAVSSLKHRITLALIIADLMIGIGNTESGSEEDSYEDTPSEVIQTRISRKRNRKNKNKSSIFQNQSVQLKNS